MKSSDSILHRVRSIEIRPFGPGAERCEDIPDLVKVEDMRTRLGF